MLGTTTCKGCESPRARPPFEALALAVLEEVSHAAPLRLLVGRIPKRVPPGVALPQTVGTRLLRLLSGLGTPPVQERGCSTLLRRLPPSSPFFLLSFPSFLSPLLQPNHLNQPGLGSPYYRHFRPFSLPRQNGSVQGETLQLWLLSFRFSSNKCSEGHPLGMLSLSKALKNAAVGLNSGGAGLTQSAAGEGAKEAPEKWYAGSPAPERARTSRPGGRALPPCP